MSIRPPPRSQLMREPWSTKKPTSFSTSVILGTLSSVTLSSVSSVAQRMGRMEFLLPEGVMVPPQGVCRRGLLSQP